MWQGILYLGISGGRSHFLSKLFWEELNNKIYIITRVHQGNKKESKEHFASEPMEQYLLQNCFTEDFTCQPD